MGQVKRGRGRPPKMLPSHNLLNNGNSRQDLEEPVDEISHGSELHEFFKIYLPDLCSNALRIPPDFLKKVEGKIPSIVTLEVPSGLSWQVHIHKVRDKWFFQNGWPDFVVENSIEDGDFMTFCYVGNSVFSVKIYGRNCCLKRKAGLIDLQLDESVEDVEESETESDDDTADDMVKSDSPECSSMSKTEWRNPSFSVKLKPYHLSRNCLNVPAGFSRDHLSKIKTRGVRRGVMEANATLRHRQKSWEVGLQIRGYSHRITRGLTKFARDNSFKLGDMCHFMLIDDVDLTFDVSISR